MRKPCRAATGWSESGSKLHSFQITLRGHQFFLGDIFSPAQMMSENNDSRDIRESSLSREKQELRPAFTRESSIERGAEDDETTVPSSRRRLNTNSSNTKSEDHQQRACEAEDSENIVERINITDADASFILGTGGRTKKKLARVSRAELSVTQTGRDNTVLEIRGPVDAVDRAKTYVEFVMQQRVGPVRLSSEVEERDDLVVLDVRI